MDTELLKTFLEVNRTRHFGRAAEHLCLTQSAVSGRIRQLEEMLGTALFVRARNNLRLTAHGERLVPYAETILTAWTRVKQDLAVADEAAVVLSVGGLASLWDILLTDWLPAGQRRGAGTRDRGHDQRRGDEPWRADSPRARAHPRPRLRVRIP
jgi:DNA-binding transcriptional LysR family regulator